MKNSLEKIDSIGINNTKTILIITLVVSFKHTDYSTVQLKLIVKTKFPFISPHLFHPISPDGNFGETVITHRFPCKGILFPHWGNTIPQFSSNFSIIPPDSPVSCAVLNTTSQVYIVSEQ